MNSAKNIFPRRRARAFTLVEMMVTLAIFGLVMLAMVSAHLLGLRQNQLIESKCGASDSSRRVLGQLPADIRAAKMWEIGTWNGSAFASVPNNAAMNGPALQLFQTTNNSAFIVYYFDTSDAANNNGKLMRLGGGTTNAVCLASNLVDWLTDGYSFVAENYAGIVVTNQAGSQPYKSVIHAKLQFAQFLYPLTAVGTNGLYDYYKMEFRATPHLPE
jgi:prepilin-type N-terminal cleavage/methylation domain-containing protein